MKKSLPLLLGALFLSGCASTTVSIPTDYKSHWVQPKNKKEDCLQLIEAYSDEPFGENMLKTLTWDGDCKDGKGVGLGKSILSSGAVDSYEIGFLQDGVSEQFSVSGQYGMSRIVLTKITRQNGRPQVAWHCLAELRGPSDPSIGDCWIENYKTGSAKPDNSIRYFTSSAISMLKKYHKKNTPQEPQVEHESQQVLSTGTGFFISNDGYLLTNSHVIDGSSNISVILNGEYVSATLIDQDKNNDIALLKIDALVKGLPIQIKKKTKQGTDIAVLGYPNIGLQGNEQKATFGYINANSGIQGDTRYFQIDSPI